MRWSEWDDYISASEMEKRIKEGIVDYVQVGMVYEKRIVCA